MKQNIRVIDELDGSLIYQGPATIEPCGKSGEKITIKDDTYQGKWILFEDACRIENEIPNEISIQIRNGKTSRASVHSPYGLVEISLEKASLEWNDDGVSICYSINQDPYRLSLYKEDVIPED